MKKTILFIAIAALAFSFKAIENTVWTLDKAHSKLGFSITHMMISDVEGSFKTFDITITAPNKEDFADAVVEMTADINSIDTDNEGRDNHLKNADFFDAPKYPTMTFKSTSFKKTEDKKYKIKGNLTMHGVTKEVELDAAGMVIENPYSKKPVAGFKVIGKIKRSDFGIAPTTSDAMLSDEVVIKVNAEFAKK